MKFINLNNCNYIPEYKLDLQGWNSHSKIFEKLIIDCKPKIIIEVGTWKGASAINMANLCKKYNLNTKIYCVDTWLGSIEHMTWKWKDTKDDIIITGNAFPQLYNKFLSNVFLTKNQDCIIPIPNSSEIAFNFLKHNGIKANLIYIDASHDYKSVLNDIENYYGLLANDGVIFGDDFSKFFPQVKQAVIDFSKRKNTNFNLFENKWAIKK